MAKFHINPETGNPGTCTAKTKCPYGDLESDHYPTPEIARAAYEVKMKTQELEDLQKDHKKAERSMKSSAISDRQAEQIKRGSFSNRSVSFRREYSKPGSNTEKWHGKLVGEPDDVDLSVTFTRTKIISSLSFDGKVGLVDSIPLDNADDLSEKDKGDFMLKATKKAKSKYSDRLAEDRQEILQRAKAFEAGNIVINKSPMTKVRNETNSYGDVREGSHWVGEKTAEGWTPEIYVHNGTARALVRNSKIAQVTELYAIRLTDGFNSFATGSEAARFLKKADEKVQKFQGF